MGRDTIAKTIKAGGFMNTDEAVKYLRMVSASFDPDTAPRFKKENIQAERDKARAAVALAIASLEGGL
jgi:hypothetical protein